MSKAYTRSALSADRPFPGLRPYRFEDHDFFFGREDQIVALYRLFDHSRLVTVVGSSGSGKSSLVRAGLLPLLNKESEEPTGRSWKMIQMHPGDAPIGGLAAAMAEQLFVSQDVHIAAARNARIKFALRRSSFGMSEELREIEELGDASIVLVVDQFEELFRYTSKQQVVEGDGKAKRQEEATQFVQVLLTASRERALNVYVLLTMRSDFIGDCASFRGLPEAVSASQFLVPSLTRDQREQAIRGPIESIGAAIEPALVERLLNDSGDDIDQLPVLQHCLLRVREAAGRSGGRTAGSTGRCLTVQNYLDVGGIADALSTHADEVLQSLSGAELAVEQTFRSLAEIDLEGRVVRRARLFRELLAETGVSEQDLRTVVDRFRDEDCSFLIPSRSEVISLVDDTRIDVAHEALLRRWDRVSGDPRTGSAHTGWLREEVADGRAYRGLLMMAESKDRIGTDTVEERWKRWNERPRTVAWADRYGGHLDEVKRLFNESLVALEAQREREQRQAEAEREQERLRIAEAEERKRMQIEASAAHEREVAALRIARLTRLTAIVVSCLLFIAIALGAFSFQQSILALQAKTTEEANLNISISLLTSLLNKIQDLLDMGQITVDAARQFLTTADATSRKFEAAEQTPAIMASRVTLLVAFADTYAAMQDYKSSLQFAQTAQEIARKLVAADSSNTAYQTGLYNADFSAADAESWLYLIDDSMRDYRSALSITETMAPNDPTKYQWMRKKAFVLNKIGDTYDLQGNVSQGLKTYQAALAINQQLAGDNPNIADNANNAGLQRDLATSLARVADVESSTNPDDALAKLNTALTIRKTLANNSPSDKSLLSNISATYNLIGGVYMKKKDYANAAAQYDMALQIRQKVAESDPTNKTWQSDLAYEYVYLGNVMMAQQNYPAAAGNYQQSLTIRQALVDLDPSNFIWMKYLADSYTKLAGAALAQNNVPDALADHKAALPLRVKISAKYPDTSGRINEYLAIGDIMVKQGNREDAATSFKDALNVAQTFSSKYPNNTSLNSISQMITEKIHNLNSKRS